MKQRPLSRLFAIAITAALAFGTAASAEEPRFDLEFRLKLSSEFTSALRDGDTLQAVLRPHVQFGQRTVAGQPIVLETAWKTGKSLETTLNFEKALEPDQLYHLELRIVRADERGRMQTVRYLSALDKLPRRPVGHAIPLRLHQGHRRDLRENIVMLTKDADNVYRVTFFTA